MPGGETMRERQADAAAPARDASPRRVDTLSSSHAALLALQETAGNAAVVGALHAAAMPVQRHFKQGVKHAPHPKDKHTKADAEAAGAWAKALAEEAKQLAATAEKAKQGRDAASVLQRLQEISEITASLFEVVNTCSDAQTKSSLIGSVRTWRDQAVGASGRAQSAEERLARSEHEARVKLSAPSHLARIEANAIETTRAAKEALAAGTTSAARAALTKAERAMEVVNEVRSRFDAMTAEVARFPQVRTLLQPYANDVGAATTVAQRMVKICGDRTAALLLVDQKKAAVTAYEKAQQEARDAEETAVLAAEIVAGLEAYVAVVLPVLDQVGATGAIDASRQKSAVNRELAEARQQKVDAEAYLAQSRDELAATEKVDQTDVSAAEATASAAAATAATGPESPTSAEGELSLVGEARSLAGGTPELAALTARMPDKTQLIALLKAVGAPTARRWLDEQTIGTARVQALFAAFGEAGLKKLVTEVGGPKLDGLVAKLAPARLRQLADDAQLGTKELNDMASSFEPLAVDDWATELGLAPLKALLAVIDAARLKTLGLVPAKVKAALADIDATALKVLMDQVGEAKVKDYFTELTPKQVKDLLPHLPADVLKRLDLTGANLKDLLTQFTGGEIKQLAADLGDLALKDLLTKFTAATLEAYRTQVGADRLKELITVKQLKADALHTYGATMLKTFVGAGAAALDHLVTAHFNAVGKVSGAHDEQVFSNFINTRYPNGQRYGRITANPGAASVYTVDYDTFLFDGTVWNSGRKTLIQGLTGDQATWKASFNAAIWKSIQSLTFPVGGGAFTATVGGRTYAGYYTPGRNEVDTVFPQ